MITVASEEEGQVTLWQNGQPSVTVHGTRSFITSVLADLERKARLEAEVEDTFKKLQDLWRLQVQIVQGPQVDAAPIKEGDDNGSR